MVSTHLAARAMSVSLVHFTECQVLDSDAPGSASLFPLCATPDGTLTLFWLYSARSYKLYNDSKKILNTIHSQLILSIVLLVDFFV